MSARICRCSAHQRQYFSTDWQMARVPTEHWSAALVPGTVAAALRQSGEWSLEQASRDFDAEDWWYRYRFDAPPASPGEQLVLGLEGLATLAEVSLNGQPLFESNNMFLAHEVDVTALLQPANELLIHFSPVQPLLAQRRPRPRWRTPMVAHQQLRWIRTTLLGRTPGWSPPAAPVGPWRPVWLERRRHVNVTELQIRAQVRGTTGRLSVTCRAQLLGGSQLRSAAVQLAHNGREYRGEMQFDPATSILTGEVDVQDVELWWPHTHGEPALYDAGIHLEIAGAQQPPAAVQVDLAQVGFRTLELDRRDGDFALRINGQDIFCRGAVWTPLDCVSLQADATAYRTAVAQARAAGMNMLRVAGPFVYEDTGLLAACAAAGMLVWQDFMFANMDYPAADPGFAASVAREVRQRLEQWQGQPALAVLCGNSEVSQQAAMSGADRAHWLPALFEETLAGSAREHCPDVPYCPSSTHGGDFPFSARQGVTSYYGVGAYLRAAGDARRSELRFASECLAFANVPETETLQTAAERPLHFNQPRWKERVPRDLGAGWDFDDVRDHYLQQLFSLPVAPLRYSDQDRYLRLSRITSGEAMAGAFAEWRRARSTCRGALLLFLRDLWPGAGWGIIDSTGLPKAPYYYLRRVLRNVALFVTDEGNNGLSLHLRNETSQPLRGQLQLELYNASQPVGRPVSREIQVGAAAALELNALDWFEGFLDLSYAYRFGPPAYDVLRVSFAGEGIPQDTEAFHFPLGLPNTRADIGLSATAREVPEGVAVEVTCQAFAHAVHIEAAGYCADDQYFHLAPRARRIITLRRRGPQSEPFEGLVWAANAQHPRRVESAS